MMTTDATTEWNGLRRGDPCRIRGEAGTFRFERWYRDVNDEEVCDLYGGRTGYGGYRTVRAHRVLVPKRRSKEHRQPERQTTTMTTSKSTANGGSPAERLAALGWSRSTLAQKAGVTASVAHSVLLGKKQRDPSAQERVLQALADGEKESANS